MQETPGVFTTACNKLVDFVPLLQTGSVNSTVPKAIVNPDLNHKVLQVIRRDDHTLQPVNKSIRNFTHETVSARGPFIVVRVAHGEGGKEGEALTQENGKFVFQIHVWIR